ncbi:MAG TPA: alpha/beta hydrolase [Spongiibacteraceae bacterium]|jgi:alpha-beta hydrolase superfamily lysophospholipase
MAIQFDSERLHQQIRPFSIADASLPGDAEQAYFHFYGIDFENKIAGVAHYFGHFSSDKYDIVVHYFSLDADSKKSRGTCFIFHGYFDHAGLFKNLIEYCLRRDLNVVIYDLPGHGLSTGERVSIPSFSDYLTVMKDCLKLFADIAPRPWHAIAQSTGAAILMDYQLQELPPGFDKIVLLGPLVRAAEWRLVKLAYWVGSKFLEKVPRKFGGNSSDLKFIEFVEKTDPLQARYIAVRWVDALLRWESRFDHLPTSDKPILIMQGQRDTTVDWRYNIPAIRKKFPKARYLPLQEAYHHLANESPEIRAKMFAAMDMYFENKDT